MNKTGAEKSTPLSEFHRLCLDVLRAAKGDEILEGISDSVESSGNDTENIIETTQHDCTQPISIANRNVDASSIPSSSIQNRSYFSTEKLNLLNSMSKNDSERNEREKSESNLRRYNFLLDVIEKERKLNLSENEISLLRASIDEGLVEGLGG